MTPYPADLTTSDWVDWLMQPSLTRDEQIAGLATCHRRVEEAAKHDALSLLRAQAPKEEAHADIFHASVDAAVAAVPTLGNYQPADQAPADAR